MKLPAAPPVAALRSLVPDVRSVAAGTPCTRIYALGGAHPAQWNAFRHWGPAPKAGRFDHHLPPPAQQARGMLYAARDFLTCVAETFQVSRRVDRVTGTPCAVVFEVRRDLRLLDLTGLWPTRAGASVAIASGPRPRAQAWARAIYTAYPDLDGIWYGSSMAANRPCVALTERAADALPARPLVNRPLTEPDLTVDLVDIATALGYEITS